MGDSIVGCALPIGTQDSHTSASKNARGKSGGKNCRIETMPRLLRLRLRLLTAAVAALHVPDIQGAIFVFNLPPMSAHGIGHVPVSRSLSWRGLIDGHHWLQSARILVCASFPNLAALERRTGPETD